MDKNQGNIMLRSHLYNYCPASNLAFNELVKSRISNGEEIYHFGFGQSPFPPMSEMITALGKYAYENSYLEVAGMRDLREQIANFHTIHDKITPDADDIVVGPGSKELIFLLLTVFSGDVLILSPSWTTYAPQARLSGHSPVIVDTSFEHSWKVATKELEKALTKCDKITEHSSGYKLLIMCNPDNPTGTSYKEKELEHIGQFCQENNIIVLSDEIYSRLHYQGNHVSLKKYYDEGTILSSGFSKWSSAGGWRLGYHIFPKQLEALKNAVKSAASHTYSCAPAPMQFAVASVLKDEEACKKYICHSRRILQAVAQFCHRELENVGVECVKPTAGYYIFPNFEVCKKALTKRGISTCQEMCELILKEIKVALMAGGPAFLRPLDELTVRLCFVNFDGSKALRFSYDLGLEKSLPNDFVERFAPLTYAGIKKLTKWVSQLQA